jgi:hypothetical protein
MPGVHAQDPDQVPTLRASRLYAMVRERALPGCPRLVPRPGFAAASAARRRSVPTATHSAARTGEWTGRPLAKLSAGRALRPLMAFVVVLSHSGHLFLRFVLRYLDELLRTRPCRCVCVLCEDQRKRRYRVERATPSIFATLPPCSPWSSVARSISIGTPPRFYRLNKWSGPVRRRHLPV